MLILVLQHVEIAARIMADSNSLHRWLAALTSYHKVIELPRAQSVTKDCNRIFVVNYF